MSDGALLLRLGRAIAYIALTLPLMPVQALLLRLKSPWSRHVPFLYHRMCCRLLGYRVHRRGTPSSARPTLFVSNHISYLDILVLSSAVEASFIAKSEIARWPFFGWLAKLQRSVFVDRRVRSTAAQRDAIKDRLDAGDSLFLFPEGTSGDGIHMLPFKSALFSVAEYAPGGQPLIVQPVSVAYLRLDGMPLGRFYRPFFAWYGDMALGPHLWTVLGFGAVDVMVMFHPPVTFSAFGSRKALSEHCQRVVAAGLSTALAGRLPEEHETAPVPARARAGAAMADAAQI